MQKRGRQSAASVEASVIVGNFGTRPEPPTELTVDEAAIWKETTASEAANFFGTAALRGLLKDYCRHRAAADKITEIINLFQTDWLKSADGAKRYSTLLKMRDLEARGAADKATKLRLTNQARYTPQAASTASRNAAKGLKPWEL
jgi:hypothetical protein